MRFSVISACLVRRIMFSKIFRGRQNRSESNANVVNRCSEISCKPAFALTVQNSAYFVRSLFLLRGNAFSIKVENFHIMPFLLAFTPFQPFGFIMYCAISAITHLPNAFQVRYPFTVLSLITQSLSLSLSSHLFLVLFVFSLLARSVTNSLIGNK